MYRFNPQWVGLFALLAWLGGGASSGTAASLVINGAMSEGGTAPAGWSNVWTAGNGGRLRVVQDTNEYRSAPASLCLMSLGGSAEGNVSQAMPNAAGKTLVISGFVKSRDEGRGLAGGSVTVLVIDARPQITFHAEACRWETIRKGDWTGFTNETAIPENAPAVMLVLSLKGEGRIWLDDVDVHLKESRKAGNAPVTGPVPRGPGSPKITAMATVASSILSITVEAGQIDPSRLIPYAAQPGDEKKETRLPNGVVDEVRLIRQGKAVGWLAGAERKWLCTFESLVGDALQTERADWPATYRITSPDDPSFTNPVPVAVYRKSKPMDWAQPGWECAVRHRIYLVTTTAFTPGRTYRVSFGDLNVERAESDYRHEPERTRSEAVHVSQIGYRPDDPGKRAYLSLWLGSGGKHAFPEALSFALIDERDERPVFHGKIQLAMAASEPEQMARVANFNKTDVYRMDFDTFSRPGRYRVSVEGIGCSYPFEIKDDVWEKAFQIAMKGFLNQRSGIELGPPFSPFRHPRDFHPEDGVTVYASTCSLMDSGNGLNARGTDKNNFGNLVAGRTTAVVTNAWGGYHDAGDWDRRIQHLEASLLHLELTELFPDYFAGVNLGIPESLPKVPDLVHEALWNIDCYRRTQLPGGAVRGGVESAEHPRNGETSWLESLPVMAYAPGIWESYIYAAAAARAALVLKHFESPRAKEYETSATSAMRWAEAEYRGWRSSNAITNRPHEVFDARNRAALELYRLTRARSWHEIFREDTCLKNPQGRLFEWTHHLQRDAAFVYARLPDALADLELKKTAIQGTVRDAEDALRYASGNAFNLTTADRYRPLYAGFYTTPEAIPLVRAHILTGKEEYLRGIIRACQFAAGANPDNITFTTGAGLDWPRHPLHLDSRRTGQAAPVGLTVLGPFDYALASKDATFTWPLGSLGQHCSPPFPEWPTTENYLDVFLYPIVCEFTIHQNLGPNSYVWGYLAARPTRPKSE